MGSYQDAGGGGGELRARTPLQEAREARTVAVWGQGRGWCSLGPLLLPGAELSCPGSSHQSPGAPFPRLLLKGCRGLFSPLFRFQFFKATFTK